MNRNRAVRLCYKYSTAIFGLKVVVDKHIKHLSVGSDWIFRVVTAPRRCTKTSHAPVR